MPGRGVRMTRMCDSCQQKEYCRKEKDPCVTGCSAYTKADEKVRKLHTLLREVSHHLGAIASCLDTVEYDPILEEDKKEMYRCMMYNIKELGKSVARMEKEVGEVAE